MLRFVVGVGIHSVPGADIEQALLQVYSPDEFDILPINETPCTVEQKLYVEYRAKDFAQKALRLRPASVAFGITSGTILTRSRTEDRTAQARWDIVVGQKTGCLPDKPLCLNVYDVGWQMDNKKCALASCPESLTNLLSAIHKHCAAAVSAK